MNELLVFDLRGQKRYFSQVRLELYKEIEYLSRIRKLFHYNLFKKRKKQRYYDIMQKIKRFRFQKCFFQKVPTFSDSRVYMGESFQ